MHAQPGAVRLVLKWPELPGANQTSFDAFPSPKSFQDLLAAQAFPNFSDQDAGDAWRCLVCTEQCLFLFSTLLLTIANGESANAYARCTFCTTRRATALYVSVDFDFDFDFWHKTTLKSKKGRLAQQQTRIRDKKEQKGASRASEKRGLMACGAGFFFFFLATSLVELALFSSVSASLSSATGRRRRTAAFFQGLALPCTGRPLA